MPELDKTNAPEGMTAVQVPEDHGCEGCAFEHELPGKCPDCCECTRADGCNVIFEEDCK